MCCVLRRHIPAIAGRWLRGSACLYAATPDNRFLIGPVPDRPRILLATGLGGHGFKFTPTIGELVADLVTGAIGSHSDRLAPFDPARFVSGDQHVVGVA
jgi:sarcosine oxidase